MKKLLSLLGTVSIMASGASYVASVSTDKIQKYNVVYKTEDKIDWDNTQEEFKNVFDNIKENLINNNLLKISNNIDQDKILEYIEFSKNKAEQILSEVSSKNLGLDDTIEYVKVNNEQFVNSFNKGYDQFTNMDSKKIISTNFNVFGETNFNFLKFDNNFLSKLTPAQKNSELISKLKVAKLSLSSLSAAAAVAAAGFWAGSFWSFGATIPWAVGCSTVAGFLGAAAGGVSIALKKYNKDMSNWEKFGSVIGATISLGQVLATTSKILLINLTAGITPFCWCMPTLIALIATIGAIIAWIDGVKF
ncbi:hypothetical protein [Spiroplasma taiwanense]|uniref:Transmembrane protein n=1 Tax=Spiroplasma taiwanense CT-1 TaxID=1276220 RepID=S5MDB1_9MOLU|nr:hypothetical protein [Spiroplasma taiwanense]AGR41693.1 hypothetical protein STAIW_v1c11100 [Spiroplasma taiwanense CT-1]